MKKAKLDGKESQRAYKVGKKANRLYKVRGKNAKSPFINGLPTGKESFLKICKRTLRNIAANTEIRQGTHLFKLLKWLFAQHPKGAQKVPSKITRIAVVEHKAVGYNKKTKCFMFLCQCGAKDTISYRACIENFFNSEYVKFRRFSNACRNTLELNRFARWRKLVDGKKPFCAITGAPLTSKNVAFDHYNVKFSVLMGMVIAKFGGIDRALQYLVTLDSLEQLHPQTAIGFLKFHDENSNVRAILKTENDRLNHQDSINKKMLK